MRQPLAPTVQVCEAAPGAVAIAESRPLTEAAPTMETSGRLSVQIISPGWGSSGYYSARVLEAAATNRIFAAGTHMYLDHPGLSEQHDRPVRSVRDLAAVLTEDATWDADAQALVATAQVFGPYAEALVEMRDAIGVSIRADATVEIGEAEGRRGTIVTELVEATSVDFVTQAGRGGRILSVLESARHTASARLVEAVDLPVVGDRVSIDPDSRHDPAHDTGTVVEVGTTAYGVLVDAMPEMGVHRWYTAEEFTLLDATTGAAMSSEAKAGRRRTAALPAAAVVVEAAVARGVAEATANDTREALQTALRDRFTGDRTYVWVRDFDDSSVWYELETADEAGTYQQAYTSSSDGAVALGDGDPIEVRARTEYVPVTPAGQSTTTQESEEDTMPQIEEARLRQLEADAGRVQTAEEARTAAEQRAQAAERELQESRARDAARPIATEVIGASESLPPSTRTRLVEAAVTGVSTSHVGEDGTLDDVAFRTACEAARTQAETELAEAFEAAGAGKPTGNGDRKVDEAARSRSDAAQARAFGRPVKEA